jgi:hypothetical protein
MADQPNSAALPSRRIAQNAASAVFAPLKNRLCPQGAGSDGPQYAGSVQDVQTIADGIGAGIILVSLACPISIVRMVRLLKMPNMSASLNVIQRRQTTGKL